MTADITALIGGPLFVLTDKLYIDRHIYGDWRDFQKIQPIGEAYATKYIFKQCKDGVSCEIKIFFSSLASFLPFVLSAPLSSFSSLPSPPFCFSHIVM